MPEDKMHTVKVIRKNIVFPEELLSEAASLTKELRIDFSKLIRNALYAYIRLIKKEKMAQEFEEEALANRDFYRTMQKDFEEIELETWL
jgi:hypothetical protein